MAKYEFDVASVFSSDATFRAIGSAWKTAFEAVLTRAPGTGMINWASVAMPSGAGEIKGFETYVFPAEGGLQPFYVQVTYGSSPSGSNYMNITMGAGFAIDATGAITGPAYNVCVLACNGYASVGRARLCYSDGALVVHAPAPSFSYSGFLAVLERTRNADGSPNSDGAVGARLMCGAPYRESGYCLRDGSYNRVTTNVNCCPVPGSSGSTGNNIYLTPVRAIGFIEYPPLLGVSCYFNPDLTSMVAANVTAWNGTTHTILPLGDYTYGCETGGMANVSNTRTAMLWE